ncbi:MAG TPA: PQQ-binding-like beta-propeller repeat protein [Planctomycetota bacterium]|nr:PQQ-binding-like beta-propeller repeat protein [Planctomycetota bacterium]
MTRMTRVSVPCAFWPRTILAAAACACALHVAEAGAPSPEKAQAEQVLAATGVRGGLVVHLGCSDGRLTAALRAGDGYVVHGLDTDAAKVATARKHIQSLGLYGPVSVDLLRGSRLPYVENLVNLVVAEDPGDVPMAEVLRVLAPNGVAYVKSGGKWIKTVKPRPADIDEWSHFLHDASGNAVANDRQIGPPKCLRWVAGPPWCRSHEFPSSVNAVVAAGGRIFTIFDEAPSGVYRKLPQRCSLIARDAANGVLLWKVPMQQWQPEFGTGTGGRWAIHHTIPRRLVAEGDHVYVTLRFLDSPVSVLDAATGKVLAEAIEGTQGADEMILSDGILIVKITQGRSVAATARFAKDALDDTLAAIDVERGKQLWRKEHTRVVPYALSAQAGRVVYHDMDALVCLDARTGAEVWRTPDPIGSTVGGGSTLVLSDGVVLFHGHGQPPAGAKQARKGAGKKQPQQGLYLTALSLADGKVLWQCPGARAWAGACTQPTDLFVAGGLVWCGSFQGRDLKTGEVKKTVDVAKLISPGHHYRCHRSKATERFLILPKRGAEFVDIIGDGHMRCDWLRAPCFTGATPANGLFYAPPSQCFCYPGAKVSGFLAMSAEPADALRPSAEAAIERGPAYGKTPDRGEASAEDWPMHRRDGQRSGATRSAVPAELSKQWELELACQGSQPVIVGDRLWVAEMGAHRIRCLGATDGKGLWSFTAGGRIDSAPTVHDGLVLFGCRDGYVYCLRAADGALVWRFRAAPDDRRLVSFEQVESVWPVQGSVLVQDGVVYFAAGRSSFLDGGILAYGLDVKTGKVLYHHHLEGPWPDIKKDTGRPFAMEGALPDLLVSDGKDLYMGQVKFDARLNRLATKQESDLGELDMGADHLVATGGFLDDTGFDRLYWMHSRRWPGFYFAQHAPKSGQLVVFDDRTTYAVKYFYRRVVWSPLFIPGEQGYLLFADDIDNEPVLEEKGKKVAIQWLPKEAYSDKYRQGGRGVEKGTGYVRARPAKWQAMIPLRVRAMVLAGDHLFAAGMPDVVDPDDPLAAFEGRRGALLQVFSASDGALIREHPLAAPPVFDGMSAAHGRLYLSTADRRILCFAGKQ